MSDAKVMNLWSLLRQLRDAVTERNWGAGVRDWPPPSWVWASGIVPANVTETGFEDTSKTWYGGTDDEAIYADPWNGQVHNDQAPIQWDLIIDSNVDHECVKTRIVSWTNGGALTFENVRDYVTSGRIGAVSDLVGRRYVIVRRSGLWWHDRVMEWPNAYEYAAGSVLTGTTSSITDDPDYPNPHGGEGFGNKWPVGTLAGKDLLVYADDGFLKRVTVSEDGVDEEGRRVITFATQAWTPTGDPYVVVDPGGMALPGRSKTNAFAWYRGMRVEFKSHSPGDTILGVRKPEGRTDVEADLGGGLGCGFESVVVWDEDYRTGYPVSEDDFDCGRQPDRFFAPDLYTTLRGMQKALEDVSVAYVEAKSYDGAASVPTLCAAKMFQLAGINAQTVTTTNVPGGAADTIDFSGGSFPYTPIEIVWCLVDAAGNYYKHGRGLVNTGGTSLSVESSDTPRFASDGGGGDADDEGRTMIVSLGWTRYARRQFHYMWDAAAWIPDAGDGGGAIDPAALVDYGTEGCLGAGRWYFRPRSTTYIERDPQLLASDTPRGFEDDGDTAFAEGDLARYWGDDWWGPGVRDSFGGWFRADAGDHEVEYWDKLFTGRRDPDGGADTERRAQLSGTVTAGGTHYFTDTKDWYTAAGAGGGVGHVEEGTFTSGTAAAGTDNDRSGGENACFNRAARFDGFAGGPYSGFVIKVLMSGADFDAEGAVVEKRLIATGDEGGVTYTWTPDLSATASGKRYRIREPRYLALRYAGRSVTFTRADGTTFTGTIAGGDDTTQFLDAPGPDTTGCAYAIDDPQTGGVWRWDGARWVLPEGADVVRPGVVEPVDFHDNPRENLPTYYPRYGRLMDQDAIGRHVLNEIYAACNVLVRTKHGSTWTNDGDANEKFGGDDLHSHDSWEEGVSHSLELYGDAVPFEADGARPFAGVWARFVPFDPPPSGCVKYSIARRYAYPQANGIPNDRQTPSVLFLAYGDVWPDGDNGDPCPEKRVFNDEGDDVQYRAWTELDSVSGSTDTVMGTQFGSLAAPDAVANPGDCNHKEGYRVIDEAAILKWDVGGGFTYY